MTLTVLSIAYPPAAVGPHAVGGSEQVLAALGHALVAAGHCSIVIACEGSEVAGELMSYPAPPPGHINRPFHAARQADIRAATDAVLAREHVDVIHMHGLDFFEVMPPPGLPMLATLHLPPDWYPDAALNPVRPRGRVHCVSQLQASRSVSPVLLSPIPNGVPVTALGALHPKRCSYALAGLHHALAAARAARTSLLIGRQVFP